MVFNLVALLLAVVIVYWHYVQGFFTSIISAVCAALAALLALGHAEWITATFLGGRGGELAEGAILGALFVLIYGLLRFVIDKAAPDGVRVPVSAEKAGAVVAGAVVAAFTVGTVAVAAQLLPFGPGIGMGTRYAVEDPEVTVLNSRRQRSDIPTQYALADGDAFERPGALLYVPFDNWLVGLTRYQSGTGALARTDMARVNPRPLDVAYGTRLGNPMGGRLTVPVGVVGRDDALTLENAYRLDAPVAQVEGVTEGVADAFGRNADDTYTPSGTTIVLRVVPTRDAADPDGSLRFAPAGVPVVADGQLVLPIGTMQGDVLVRQRADDLLVLPLRDGGFSKLDLVYELPAGGVAGERLADDVLLQFKRFGRVPLDGLRLLAFEADPAAGLARPDEVLAAIEAADAPAADDAEDDADAAADADAAE